MAAETTVKYYISQIADDGNESVNLITNESNILSNTGRFMIIPFVSDNTGAAIIHEYCYEEQAYKPIDSSVAVTSGYGKYIIQTTINDKDPIYTTFYLRAQYTDLSTFQPVIIEGNSSKEITQGTEFDSEVLVQFEGQLPFDLEIFKVEIDGIETAPANYNLSGLLSPISEIGSHDVVFYVRNRDNYNTGTISSKLISITFVIVGAKLDWNIADNIPEITFTTVGMESVKKIEGGIRYFNPPGDYYGTEIPTLVIDWEAPPKVAIDYLLKYYQNVTQYDSNYIDKNTKSQIIGDFERGVTMLNGVGYYELTMKLTEEGLENPGPDLVERFIIAPNGIDLSVDCIHCSINGMVELKENNDYFMKSDTVIPDAFYNHYINGAEAVDVTDRIEMTCTLVKWNTEKSEWEDYAYQNGFTQLTEVGSYKLTVLVKEIFNDGNISAPVSKVYSFEIKDIPMDLNALVKDLVLRDSESNEVIENKTYNKGTLNLKAPMTTEGVPILMYIQGPGFTNNVDLSASENKASLTEEGSYSIELKIVDPNYSQNTVSKYYEIILYNPENHKGENLCPINIYINGILRDIPTGTDEWRLPLDELNILGPCNIVAVNSFALNNQANPENFNYSVTECTFEIVNREYLETPFIYTTKDTSTKWYTTDLFVDYPISTRLEKCKLEIYKNDETSPCFSKSGTELNKIYKVNDSNTIKLTLPGEIINGASNNGFTLEQNDSLKIIATYNTTLLSETIDANETIVVSEKILENYEPYDPGDIEITGFTNANNTYYTVIPDVMRYQGCDYTATITSAKLGLTDHEITLGSELFSNPGVNKPSVNSGSFPITITVKVKFKNNLDEEVEKSLSKTFNIDRDVPQNVNFLPDYIKNQIYNKGETIINNVGTTYAFNPAQLRVFLNNRRIYPENNATVTTTNPLNPFKYILNNLQPGGYCLMITFENPNNGKVVSYQEWFNVVGTPLNRNQRKPLIPLKGKVDGDGNYTYNIAPENEELVQIVDSTGETTGQVAIYKEGLTINKMSELKDSVDYFEDEVTLLQSDIALNESKTNAIKPVATSIGNELKSTLIRKSINAEVLINNHYNTCDEIVLSDVSEITNTKVENIPSVSNCKTNGINLNLLIRKISGRALDILNTIENYQNLASATAEVMYTYNNNMVNAKNEEILPAGMSVSILDKVKIIDLNGETNPFVVTPGCVITARAALETPWAVLGKNRREIMSSGRSTEFTFRVNKVLGEDTIILKAPDLANSNQTTINLLSLTMTY